LRSLRDRAALRAGLLDGTIDAICTNHAPVDEDAKQLPFAEAESGATGLELLLPLVLKWAQQEKLTLSDALARTTLRPAQILGLDAGHLSGRCGGRGGHIRPGNILACGACRIEEPGQKYAVHGTGSARSCPLHFG